MNVNPNQWLDCDDEMKMGSFIENFHDQNALRKFALLNAKSIVQQMIDDRSQNAVAIAEAYLNGEVSQNDLERAYSDADAAHDKIVAAHMSDNDPTQSELSLIHI